MAKPEQPLPEETKLELIEWADKDGHHCKVVAVLAHFTHESETVARMAGDDFCDTLKRLGEKEKHA